MIQIHQLVKKFSKQSSANHAVFDRLSLSIPEAEFVGILGPSGCGKSTLLRMIAGLESADSGEIRLRDFSKIGFVFQDSNLLPWLSVEENASLPFRFSNEPVNLAELEDWMDKLNLTSARKLFPHQLSGGMKMRASFLRSMMMRPKILLLDEPFAALDEVIRVDLQELLFKFCREQMLTVLFVTHSISEAVKICHRLILLDYGGKIILDRQQDLKQYHFEMSQEQQALSSEVLKIFPHSRDVLAKDSAESWGQN